MLTACTPSLLQEWPDRRCLPVRPALLPFRPVLQIPAVRLRNDLLLDPLVNSCMRYAKQGLQMCDAEPSRLIKWDRRKHGLSRMATGPLYGVAMIAAIFNAFGGCGVRLENNGHSLCSPKREKQKAPQQSSRDLIAGLTPLRGLIVYGEAIAVDESCCCRKSVSSDCYAFFLNGRTLELSARSICPQSFIISALSAQ